jgi:hypothetical protein
MYNFKRNVKAYIVELDAAGAATNRHQIELYSDISASQTFDEQGFKRKTLHNLTDLHDYAVVNNANVANFSFTTPLLSIQNGTPIVLTLGGTYSSGTITNFDLYIESDYVIYLVKKCVIESMAFNLERNSILTVSVGGTAQKISKFGNVGSVTVPGTPFSVGTKSYASIDLLSINIGGSVLDSIAGVHVDLRNDISWYQNNTLQEAIAGTTMYPGNYVLQGRTLSGSITQFLTSVNVDTLVDASTTSSIVISIYYRGYSTTTPLLQFNLPSTVFTRRLNFEEIINRVYDFRLNSNSTTVKPIYKGV